MKWHLKSSIKVSRWEIFGTPRIWVFFFFIRGGISAAIISSTGSRSTREHPTRIFRGWHHLSAGIGYRIIPTLLTAPKFGAATTWLFASGEGNFIVPLAWDLTAETGWGWWRSSIWNWVWGRFHHHGHVVIIIAGQLDDVLAGCLGGWGQTINFWRWRWSDCWAACLKYSCSLGFGLSHSLFPSISVLRQGSPLLCVTSNIRWWRLISENCGRGLISVIGSDFLSASLRLFIQVGSSSFRPKG